MSADFGIHADLAARRREFCLAFRNNDFSAAVDIYTTDCKYMTEGYNVMQGRREMLHHLERRYKDDYMNVSLVPDEILQIGDLAIERGTWMLRSSDGIVTASGNHITVWKFVEGDWYVHFLCENNNNNIY